MEKVQQQESRESGSRGASGYWTVSPVKLSNVLVASVLGAVVKGGGMEFLSVEADAGHPDLLHVRLCG